VRRYDLVAFQTVRQKQEKVEQTGRHAEQQPEPIGPRAFAQTGRARRQ